MSGKVQLQEGAVCPRTPGTHDKPSGPEPIKRLALISRRDPEIPTNDDPVIRTIYAEVQCQSGWCNGGQHKHSCEDEHCTHDVSFHVALRYAHREVVPRLT